MGRNTNKRQPKKTSKRKSTKKTSKRKTTKKTSKRKSKKLVAGTKGRKSPASVANFPDGNQLNHDDLTTLQLETLPNANNINLDTIFEDDGEINAGITGKRRRSNERKQRRYHPLVSACAEQGEQTVCKKPPGAFIQFRTDVVKMYRSNNAWPRNRTWLTPSQFHWVSEAIREKKETNASFGPFGEFSKFCKELWTKEDSIREKYKEKTQRLHKRAKIARVEMQKELKKSDRRNGNAWGQFVKQKFNSTRAAVAARMGVDRNKLNSKFVMKKLSEMWQNMTLSQKKAYDPTATTMRV